MLPSRARALSLALVVSLAILPQALQASKNAARPLAGPQRPATVPANYIVTPFGYLHPSCVQTLAKGEQLLKDGRIQHADGTSAAKAAVCAHPRYSQKGEAVDTTARRSPHANTTPEIDGWVEDANVTPTSATSAYGAILATWAVPPSPTSNDGQILYFFPGLEDIDSGASILQPVLGWYAGQWTIASWNCCINGVVTNSTPVNVSPGDAIYGSVTNNCPPGTLTCAAWNVLTVDLTTGQSTTLLNAPSEGQTFNWAFGGVLEAYYIDHCSDYPDNPGVEFEYVNLFDQNLKLVPNPKWINDVDYDDHPQCSYGLKSTAHTVTASY